VIALELVAISKVKELQAERQFCMCYFWSRMRSKVGEIPLSKLENSRVMCSILVLLPSDWLSGSGPNSQSPGVLIPTQISPNLISGVLLRLLSIRFEATLIAADQFAVLSPS
jgi:hypothetical protein